MAPSESFLISKNESSHSSRLQSFVYWYDLIYKLGQVALKGKSDVVLWKEINQATWIFIS